MEIIFAGCISFCVGFLIIYLINNIDILCKKKVEGSEFIYEYSKEVQQKFDNIPVKTIIRTPDCKVYEKIYCHVAQMEGGDKVLIIDLIED